MNIGLLNIFLAGFLTSTFSVEVLDDERRRPIWLILFPLLVAMNITMAAANLK